MGKSLGNQALKRDNNRGKRKHTAGSKGEIERKEIEKEDGSGWEFVL